MSEPKAKGESMSTMRNFGDGETSPSQDRKSPSTPKYGQERAIVIPDFIKGKKMNVGSDPVGDETYKQAKAIAWEQIGWANEARENLLNEIMMLHTKDGIGFDVLAKACELWDVGPAWSNGNSPGPSQLHVYVEQLTRPSKPEQTSFAGANARCEDKEYETLDGYFARENSMTLEECRNPTIRRIAEFLPVEYRDDLVVLMMEVWSKDSAIEVKEEDARSSPSQEGKVLPAAQVRPNHTPTAPSRDINVITIRAQRIVDRLPAKYRGGLLHAMISKWTDDPSIEYETMKRMAQAAVALSIEEDRPMLRLVGG
jgi:hypothetical protein